MPNTVQLHAILVWSWLYTPGVRTNNICQPVGTDPYSQRRRSVLTLQSASSTSSEWPSTSLVSDASRAPWTKFCCDIIQPHWARATSRICVRPVATASSSSTPVVPNLASTGRVCLCVCMVSSLGMKRSVAAMKVCAASRCKNERM